MINSSPPVLRNIEIDQVGVAQVNVGRTAVDAEVLLNGVYVYRQDEIRRAQSSSEDLSYQGVVDINHKEASDDDVKTIIDSDESAQQNEDPDSNDQQQERLKTVSNKYIPTPDEKKSTGDEPYPERPPLLAPN